MSATTDSGMATTTGPVTVLDPVRGQAVDGRLLTGPDGLLRLIEEPDSKPDGAIYLTPGWVDLHAHVYDGVTQTSVHPDRVGLDHGVHVLADAGSAGQATLRGLVNYVIPQADTTIRSWLNIGSHGLVHLREVADPTFIDVDASLAAIAACRDVVCGVKVRSSGLIVGAMGLQPLQLGRLVAREAELPLMVHIGEAPPDIADVLDLLDAGDVVTHCYHGKTGRPWLTDGSPSPALRRALTRGVLLDVGHGAASFDVNVARAALSQGYHPNSISTDIHVRNIDGPVFDIATVMTKLLDCGLPLLDVIVAVTSAPRRILDMDSVWLGPEGIIQHATLFRLAERPPAGRTYIDAGGNASYPHKHIAAVATIRAGIARACGASPPKTS